LRSPVQPIAIPWPLVGNRALRSRYSAFALNQRRQLSIPLYTGVFAFVEGAIEFKNGRNIAEGRTQHRRRGAPATRTGPLITSIARVEFTTTGGSRHEQPTAQ